MKSDPRLIGLAGFALGVAVGGGAVWTLQPAATPAPAARMGATGLVTRPAVPQTGSHLAKEPSSDSALRAATPSSDHPAVSPPPAAPEGRAALDELMAEITKTPENERAGAVSEFLFRMKALGPAGLKIIEDFFQRGEDVKLNSRTYFTGGRLIEAPTLRTALLNGLNDWKDPAVLDLSLKVLHETPDLMEAIVAIRNLEKRAPGAYRDDAVQTIQELLAAKPAEGQNSWSRASTALDAMRYYKSPELMAAMEARFQTQPGIVGQYFTSLQAFPAADRIAAMQRVLTNPAVTKEIVDAPYTLQQLDFTEPKLQQQAATIFTQMNAKNRDEFLNDFGSDNRFGYGGLLSGGQSRPAPSDPAADRTRAQAKLNFLDLIVPYANTPVLQQRMSDARTELLQRLKPPKQP